jgi:DNA-binding CsgD family transcriptional regulator
MAARVSELRWETGAADDAADLLARAAASLEGRPPSEAFVRVFERRAFHAVVGGIDDAGVRHAEEALLAARQLGDPELITVALNRTGLARIAHGMPEGAARLWEAFHEATQARLPHETVRAAVNLQMVLHAGGRFAEARRAGEEAVLACDLLGASRPFRAVVDALYARTLIALGEWEHAADLLADLSLPRASRFRTYVAATRAELAVGRGDGTDANAALAEVRFDGIALLRIQMAIATAELAVHEGRPDDALRIVTSIIDLAVFWPSPAAVQLCALALDAGTPDATRLVDIAEEKGRWLDTLAEPPVDTAAWLHRVRAAHAEVLGAPSSALWTAAVDAFGRIGMPVRKAEAEVRRAAAIVAEGGDRAEASRLAVRAHALAVHLGAAPLRRSVEDLARRARLDVPDLGRSTDGDLGLTEREAEVLRLVALGRTNREVAEALFISPKTASVHVSNILRKVGAANRGEASALAHRHGLVTTSEA